jgi:hypothetical protein
MSWLGWLFVAWGSAIVAIVVVWAWLGGLSRTRREDAGLDLVWEQFVEGHPFVDSDPAPRLRRHR